MQQVTSLKEIETIVNENGEAIIGKNNKNNMVIMSMEEYRNNIFDKETVQKLLKSEEDIKNGKTKNATIVIKELREKLCQKCI